MIKIKSIVFALVGANAIANAAYSEGREYTWSFDRGNMVSNWSFENEDQGWTYYDRATCAIGRGAGGTTGRYSVNASCSYFDATVNVFISSPILVQPVSHTLWFKYIGVQGGGVGPALLFRKHDGTEQVVAGSAYQEATTWTRYSLVFTPPSGAVSVRVVLARFDAAGKEGSLRFDDVVMQPTDVGTPDPAQQEELIGERVSLVDAFGRAPQTFEKTQAASGLEYRVNASTFDKFGRQESSPLPFVVNADLTKRADPLSESENYYTRMGYSANAKYKTIYADPNATGNAKTLADRGVEQLTLRPGTTFQDQIDRHGMSGAYFVPDMNMTSLPAGIMSTTVPTIPSKPTSAVYLLEWNRSPDGAWSLSWKNALGQVMRTSILLSPVSGQTDIRNWNWAHTTYVYSADGTLLKKLTPLDQANPNNPAFAEVTSYDGLRRVISTTDPTRGLVRYWYNRAGQLRFEQPEELRASNKVRYYEYDLRGRMISEGVSTFYPGQDLQVEAEKDLTAGTRVEMKGWIYDTLTSATWNALTSPSPKSRAFTPKNTWGRLVCAYHRNRERTNPTLTEPERLVADLFSYDAKGRVAAHWKHVGVDARTTNVVYSYSYDQAGRLKTRMGKWQGAPATTGDYIYNYGRNSKIDNIYLSGNAFEGTLVKYDENALGQIDRISVGEDALAAPDQMAFTNEFRFTMDGRLASTRSRTGLGTQTFQEDLGYEDKITQYTPTAPPASPTRYDGSLTSVFTSWNQSPRRSEFMDYTYDLAGRMTLARSTLNSTQGWAADFAPTNTGTATFATSGPATTSMGYDANGRTTFQVTGSTTVATAPTDAGTSVYNYTTNTYKLASISGTDVRASRPISSLTWDKDGNLTWDASRRFGVNWNSDGLPNSIYNSRNSSYTDVVSQEMLYDAQGDLAARINRRYWANPGGSGDVIDRIQTYDIIDGRRMLDVTQAFDGTAARTPVGDPVFTYHLWGASGEVGRSENLDFTEFYIKNRQGSVVRTINVTGTFTNSNSAQAYTAYGEMLPLQQNATAPLTANWTGKEYESFSRFTYFGARWWDAELGMWISPDPARQFDNPYSYGGNPVMYVDPDGRLIPLLLVLAIGAGAGLNTYSNWDAIWAKGFDPFKLISSAVIGGGAGALGVLSGGAGLGVGATIAAGAGIGAASGLLNGSLVQGLQGKALAKSTIMGALSGGAGAGVGAGIGGLLPAGTSTVGRWASQTLGAGLTGGVVGGGMATLDALVEGKSINQALEAGSKGAVSGLVTGVIVGGAMSAGNIAAEKMQAREAATKAQQQANSESEPVTKPTTDTPEQCFPAGTMIWTASGKTSIENVQPGDTVFAFDSDHRDSVRSVVKQLFHRVTDTLVAIWVKGHAIRATPNHPFWVDSLGWTPARALMAGVALWSVAEAKSIRIDSVSMKAEVSDVYNFEVADLHTYLVSDLGIGVHNCGSSNDASDPLMERIENQNQQQTAGAGDARHIPEGAKNFSPNERNLIRGGGLAWRDADWNALTKHPNAVVLSENRVVIEGVEYTRYSSSGRGFGNVRVSLPTIQINYGNDNIVKIRY